MPYSSNQKIYIPLIEIVIALVIVFSVIFAFLNSNIFLIDAADPCPVTDGGAGDADSTVNGVIEIGSNTTWTATVLGAGVFDCSTVDILVKSGVTLTLDSALQNDSDFTNDYGVTIQSIDFEVEGTGLVSADYEGYPDTPAGNRGEEPGTTNTGAGQGGGGGGYGGVGGDGGSNSNFGGDIYGDFEAPSMIDLGSAGGIGDSTSNDRGGNGGGALKLELTGDLVLNGEISADGQSGDDRSPGVTGRGGGGAGGGILIDVAGLLSGSGSITADGGNGGTLDNVAGAGGGGRIYIEYGSSSFTGSFSADGGQIPVGREGEDGTVVILNTGSNTLYIQNDQRWVPESSSFFEDTFSSITDIVICSSSSSNVECENATDIIFSLDSGNKGLSSGGYGWIFGVNSFQIDSGSTISSDGLGYDYGDGPGGGASNTATNGGGSGGSHGGQGTDGNLSSAVEINDNLEGPTDLGSGGGAGNGIGGEGTNGGGALKVITTGNLTLDGNISVDGVDVGATRGGGGAGGSVWLDIGGAFTGAGSISADGGNGGTLNDRGGSGGGGRIYVEYSTSSFTGSFSAIGGTEVVTGTAESGTILSENKTSNSLYVQGNQRWFPSSNSEFETTFPSITDLVICSATSSNAECETSSNIVLYLDSGNKDQTSGGYGWVMDLTTFSLDAGSSIDMSGYGYLGAANNAVGSGSGPGGGGTSATGGNGGGGAGHGGNGAAGNGTTGGTSYDSSIGPSDLGSGGGRGGSSAGSNGGGALKITTIGDLTLNGQIDSNANDVNSNDGGGGSGGSVWFLIGNNFAGGGDINATGGNGGISSNLGGGGSGGIVYVEYLTSSWTGACNVSGGQLPVARQGDIGSCSILAAEVQILNLDPSLNVEDVDTGLDAEMLSGDFKASGRTIRLKDGSGNVIADVTTDLNQSRNWSVVSAQSDTNNGKSVVSNLTTAPGTDSTHTLYIPRLVTHTAVSICPNASLIGDVVDGCEGELSYTENSSNVSIVEINGQSYWKVSGLTGTGGLGKFLSGTTFTLTPDGDGVSETQEVTMSYTTGGGFISGDQIQVTWENAAGLILANTCSTPTIDADSDSTTDGSASVLSNVYTYTFTANTTQTSIALCVNVTAYSTTGNYVVTLNDDNGEFGQGFYYVGDDNDVNVRAQVAPTLSFVVRNSSDTGVQGNAGGGSFGPNLCALGVLSTTVTSTCSYRLKIGTNAVSGYSVNISVDDDLNNVADSAFIDNVVEDTSVSGGTEGYGIQLNAGDATDATITESGDFADDDTPIGNGTNAILYTSDGPNSPGSTDTVNTALITHVAAADAATPAGQYTQIVTYTVSASF